MALDIQDVISQRLNLGKRQVSAVIKLLSDGATIPFIARYRKEATGSLDEVTLNNIKKQIDLFEEFSERRSFILESLKNQGVLTEEIECRLKESTDISEIEDIYLPYKPKRRSRATIAREAGLEPFAKIIMAQRVTGLENLAKTLINDKLTSPTDAIAGASDIIAEWVSESEKARNIVRQRFNRGAIITAKIIKGKEKDAANYQNYFNYSKPLRMCSSHHYLAMRRAEEEGFLKVNISIDDDEISQRLCRMFVKPNASTESARVVEAAVKDGYKRLLRPSIENEIAGIAKEKADESAIAIFADNLRHLLMEAPLGRKRILGIDPGFRSGCKIACIDEQGRLLATEVIYPCAPVGDLYGSADILCNLVGRLSIDYIAVGDGTASRETMNFLSDVTFPRAVKICTVSESGASVYSASDCARKEFPNLDITLRGAVSIARRLLDPLAELVKIDPKSIGVGQYQHDVDSIKLRDALDFTVESCVNAVGVDVNTASVELLSRVSGIGPALASNIVTYRNENGRFQSREDLLKVPRMGKKAFEQSAAFLRIPGASNPLDNTGVHPERYELVHRIAQHSGYNLEQLLNSRKLLNTLELTPFVDKNTGMITMLDIIEELAKPGRDPRIKDEEKIYFDPDVAAIADLHIGLEMNGKISNLTAFGAFVDIGLKVNGLVHISQFTEQFVKNPAEIVRVGQRVRVKVIDVDASRGRIALTMKGVPQK